MALGVGLTLPSLFIGFQLDDHIGRFIYSALPDAERLYRIYAGGYGVANGDPGDAAWMMEEGYAPWWMNPQLVLMMLRPASLWTHLLDAELWPDSAVMWHAQSLLWFAAMLLAAARTYRSIQGGVVGGLAALLLAVDHTHGVAVSFIANRYIVIGTTFALLALHEHHVFTQVALLVGSPVRDVGVGLGAHQLAVATGALAMKGGCHQPTVPEVRRRLDREQPVAEERPDRPATLVAARAGSIACAERLSLDGDF